MIENLSQSCILTATQVVPSWTELPVPTDTDPFALASKVSERLMTAENGYMVVALSKQPPCEARAVEVVQAQMEEPKAEIESRMPTEQAHDGE